MIYKIRRTSSYSGLKPHEKAIEIDLNRVDCRNCTMEYAQGMHWYKNWFENTENHIEKDGKIYGDRKEKSKLYIIDIDSLSNFIIENGECVISYVKDEWVNAPFELEIEIYDDYRE